MLLLVLFSDCPAYYFIIPTSDWFDYSLCFPFVIFDCKQPEHSANWSYSAGMGGYDSGSVFVFNWFRIPISKWINWIKTNWSTHIIPNDGITWRCQLKHEQSRAHTFTHKHRIIWHIHDVNGRLTTRTRRWLVTNRANIATINNRCNNSISIWSPSKLWWGANNDDQIKESDRGEKKNGANENEINAHNPLIKSKLGEKIMYF